MEYTGFDRVPRPMDVSEAERPLDILFIYSRSPLPMTRGDELTVAHLLEFLHARGHKVDFFTLASPGRSMREDHFAWLESRCRRVKIVHHSKIIGACSSVLGALFGWPLQIGFFNSIRLVASVRAASKHKHYDLGYAYYIRSAEALRQAAGTVSVRFLAMQLSQSLNTQRLAQTAATLPERLLYRFESGRMRRYEAKIWQTVNRTVLIGEKDLAAIQQCCADYGQPAIDNVVFGPHGVDTEQFRPRDPAMVEPASLVMSGVMKYAPNVEAAIWFVREVWPKIMAVRPDAKFYIVGRDPVPSLTALGGKNGITVTGTVEDTADWIARASVCVAPIRAAAGLQNKLLEAMAMAKAVVATSVANEGIGAVANRDLLLADNAQDMAQAILGLLANPSEGERLGIAARGFVERSWTWEGPFLQLERSFYEAIDDSEIAAH